MEKNQRKKVFKGVVSLVLSTILFMLPVGAGIMNHHNTVPVRAAEVKDATEKVEAQTGDQDKTREFDIKIKVPKGWLRDPIKVEVKVKKNKAFSNLEVKKLESKIGETGKWKDITEEKKIELKDNCTAHIKITDQNGDKYELVKRIECFDKKAPKVQAAVNDGMLNIKAEDEASGVKIVYVNGYEYKEFTNGVLNIRLQQFDTSYEEFSIQAMDNAGNMSEAYKIKNPYYKTGEDDNATPVLPTDTSPTPPTTARANITEHIQTDGDGNIVNDYLNKSVDQVPEQEATDNKAQDTHNTDSVDNQDDARIQSDGINDGANEEGTAEENKGRDFYTIQTDSQKTFYLIVDRNSGSESAYFLTEVSANDLLNVTSDIAQTLPQNSAAVEAAIPTDETQVDQDAEENVEEEKEDTKEESAGISGEVWMIGIGILILCIAVYLKVFKKKKEKEIEEEYEEEIEEDEDSEDNENE